MQRKALVGFLTLCLWGMVATSTVQAQPQTNFQVFPEYRDVGMVAPGAPYSVSFQLVNDGPGTSIDVDIFTSGSNSTIRDIIPADPIAKLGKLVTVWFSGVAPSSGSFSEEIYFTSGFKLVVVRLGGTVGSSGTSGLPPSWVGVIPQTTACPSGTTLVTFFMDDEDNDNQNNRGGWIGGITSDRNTTLRFCRVNGNQFKPLLPIKFPDPSNYYAVLSLGGPCPYGSFSFYRHFDNENSTTTTWAGPTDALGPNIVDLYGNTRLYFCLFKDVNNTLMESFPSLGFQYGVLAAPSFSRAVQSGWIFTDDEDAWGTNGNKYGGDVDGRKMVAPTGDSGRNTTLYLARTTAETRPVASCSVSPNSAVNSVQARFVDSGSYARNGRVITSYQWSFSDGSTAYGPGPHYRYFSAPLGGATVYRGTLTVTDNYGETGSASCSGQVYSDQQCPQLPAGSLIADPCMPS